MTYEEQLKTPEWRALALRIKERDMQMCQTCLSPNDLEVHHKTYISGRMAWEYEDHYLITLCDTCHKKVHSLPVAHDVSIDRGYPHETDFYEDKWRQIRQGLEGLIGLNKRIAQREIQEQIDKERGNG